MKMMNKVCALVLSVALCAGMAAPAFAYDGEPVEEVEQPVLTAATEEEEAVTVTDEETGALTPEGNLTLVDDYHTDYSDGSGQQFITLVSKSGATFYLVIDRNAKGQQTVHFMNLVDEADLLSLMEDEDAEAYTAEKEAAAQAAQERKQAEEDAKKAAEEAEVSGSEQTGGNKVTKYEIIDKAVRQIFSKMRGIPKEQIVTKRYEKETTERKNHLQDLQTQRDKAEKDLLSLKAEILACIKGESVLPRETLAEMITEQEEKLKELEDLCESASEELERTAELMDKVSRLYDELISYADLYDSANFEAKKMVVNQLIRRVDVYRGYQINISFNFDLTPYIEGE